MNTQDIKNIPRPDIFVHRARAYKVFPRDKLLHPIEKTKSACFIINTNPSYRPGEHWVVLFYDGVET